MTQKIYTFSVPNREEKTIKLLETIKAECRNTGKSFSFVVLKALEQARANDR